MRTLSVFSGVRVARSLVVCVVFCRSSFVVLSVLLLLDIVWSVLLLLDIVFSVLLLLAIVLSVLLLLAILLSVLFLLVIVLSVLLLLAIVFSVLLRFTDSHYHLWYSWNKKYEVKINFYSLMLILVTRVGDSCNTDISIFTSSDQARSSLYTENLFWFIVAKFVCG